LHVANLVRALVGILLLLSAVRQARDLATAPYFGDMFHIPVVPEAMVPPFAVYAVLTVAQLVLSVLVVLGVKAQASLLASSLVGLYVLLCDRVGYHNNGYALLLFAGILAFVPSNRLPLWKLLAGREGTPKEGPLWAQRLAQVQLALIYVGSGTSKLLDPDWRGG